MIGSVLEFADLQKISGYTRLADVMRWATDNRLPYKVCRSGIWTTIDAVNYSLGLPGHGSGDWHYPPDII